jgi:hypothetical protein
MALGDYFQTRTFELKKKIILLSDSRYGADKKAWHDTVLPEIVSCSFSAVVCRGRYQAH